MTTPSQMKEVAYLHEVFNQADKNSDGKITIKEVVETLYVVGYGCTDNDIDEMYTRYQTTVDFPEFLNILYDRINPLDEEEVLYKAFEVFDEKKDGKMNSVQFREMVTNMGNFNEDEVDEMIKDMNPDENGAVNYKEFIATISKD